jgi:heme exporter protein B
LSSNWSSEVGAVLAKEAQSEIRTKTGAVTSGVFAFATIVTVSLALYNKNPNEGQLSDVAASLVWIILLFAGLLSLPRTFLAEEEQGTADFLRLMARPHAVFWGKVLFNILQIWALSVFIALLYFALTGLRVQYPGLMAASLMAGGAAIASTVTLCGAVASHAANRAALAGAITIPLVLFPTEWGVSGLRAAVGVGGSLEGQMATLGLFGYACLSLLMGPWIYAAIWKS